MIATERLYLTVDDRVVEAGDPDARWLFAAVGTEIPDGVAAKYGLGEEAPSFGGNIRQVLAEVGDDPESARAALEAELATGKPRVTLVDQLTQLLASDEEE